MTEHASANGTAGSERARGAAAARQWLIERCHDHRLSPTQWRVAQSYLDTMPDAAFMSTSELAARAGVSQATITRFAATLGFTTYADFRASLRDIILGHDVLPSEASRDGLRDKADPVVDAKASLDALHGTLASPAMAAAITQLARAETLVIVGFRASAALAEYTGYFAARIHDDVHVLTNGDTAIDTLVQLDHDNTARTVAVLVFAMPRYPASTVRALRYAHSLPMTTVLVTDTPFVDFANDADYILAAPVGTELVFDSYAAPIVLAMTLIDGIAGTNPRRTQERLEALEDQVDAWVHQAGAERE